MFLNSALMYNKYYFHSCICILFLLITSASIIDWNSGQFYTSDTLKSKLKKNVQNEFILHNNFLQYRRYIYSQNKITYQNLIIIYALSLLLETSLSSRSLALYIFDCK